MGDDGRSAKRWRGRKGARTDLEVTVCYVVEGGDGYGTGGGGRRRDHVVAVGIWGGRGW